MKYDLKDPGTQRIISYGLVLLIFLGGILVSILNKGETAVEYLTFSNDGTVTIRDEAENETVIAYTDMTDIELIEEPDYGEAAGGTTTDDGLELGIWHSDTYGDYTRCTDTKITSCILIRTDSGIYLINTESGKSTKSLYEGILQARETLLSGE